jgi:hypothetical protein
MNEVDAFNLLIIGLKEFFDRPNNEIYPLPQNLARATQILFQTGQLPPTSWQMLQRWSQPVQNWWPEGWYVPDSFDMAFGLVCERSLTEESLSYYYSVLVGKAAITTSYRFEHTQHALDNFRFQRLLNELKAERETATEAGQQAIDTVYTQIRRYLIEYPFTTTAAIRQAFWKSRKIVSIEEISGLYEECSDNTTQWLCHRCGPLYRQNGRLRGMQPTRCNNHEHNTTQTVPWEAGMLRIRPGIHWQVYLPGVPELNLLADLERIQTTHNHAIRHLTLWPVLDQYDIRIEFSDSTAWAVDIKDHRNPVRLASTLTIIPGVGALTYRAGFYVIPDDRSQSDHTYMRLLGEKAQLPASISILTHSQFVERVTQHAHALSTKRKKA